MESKKVKLLYTEVEDFAYEILGLPDDFDGDISDVIEDKFECSFDSFIEIIRHVIQYTPTHLSPLTKRQHRGFIKDGHFILKYEVKDHHEN